MRDSSRMSSRCRRPSNPTIQSFILPATRLSVPATPSARNAQTRNNQQNLNDLINGSCGGGRRGGAGGGAHIPRVSVRQTSQLCSSQGARTFPYMQVSHNPAQHSTVGITDTFSVLRALYKRLSF